MSTTKFETKELTGSLFKNERKEKPSHPDYQGKALIAGKTYYISGWVKEGKAGKYFSFAFKEANAAQTQTIDDLAF